MNSKETSAISLAIVIMITHNINELLLMGQPRKIKRTKEHFIFWKAEKRTKSRWSTRKVGWLQASDNHNHINCKLSPNSELKARLLPCKKKARFMEREKERDPWSPKLCQNQSPKFRASSGEVVEVLCVSCSFWVLVFTWRKPELSGFFPFI